MTFILREANFDSFLKVLCGKAAPQDGRGAEGFSEEVALDQCEEECWGKGVGAGRDQRPRSPCQ